MRSTPGTSWTASSSAAKSQDGIVRRLVVIDDLPEQLDFLVPFGGRLHHLVDDVALGAHPLVAARVRHHAERAELVAAFDDGDVGLHRIVPARHPERKRHVVVRIDVDARLVVEDGLGDELGQLLQAARADHDVDHRRPLQQRPASCCATQPATATMGVRPDSALAWRISPSRV